MYLNKLLEIKDGSFGYTTSQLTLNHILKGIECGEYIICEESKTIPLKASVYKLAKGLPIFLVIAVYTDENNNVKNYIVKGGNEILNLLKWETEGVNFKINDVEASFNSLSDEEKNYLLNQRRTITVTLINSKLPINSLIEIIQSYC